MTDRYRQDHFNQHVQIGSNPPRLCGRLRSAKSRSTALSQNGAGHANNIRSHPSKLEINTHRGFVCVLVPLCLPPPTSYLTPTFPPPPPPPPPSPSLLHPGTRRRRGGDPDICRQVFGVFTMAAMIGLALPRGAGSVALRLCVTRGRLAFEKGCC